MDFSNNSLLEDIEIGRNELTAIDLSNNLLLRNLGCEYNMIENIDVSLNVKLTSLDCQNNNLSSLNIDNGKTLFFNLLKASGNNNLTCIQVDDLSNVRTTTWDYDEGVSFSTDCQYSLSVNDFDTSLESTIVYQDPTNQFVQIKSNELITSLKIYDINGNLIKNTNTPYLVDVSNISKGIYFFILGNNNKLTSKKILIK